MPRIAPFERYSEAYDQWFEEHRDLYEAELLAIGEIMPKSRKVGVEIGVGSGKFAAPLGIRFGIDPSRKMLTKAKELGIDVCLAVAEFLPFPSHTFDLALMVTTICFVDDISAAFKESYRVLRPGGSVLVGFVDRESHLGRLYEARRAESKFYSLATFYSTEEVLTHLRRAGFTISAVKQAILPDYRPDAVFDGHDKGAFITIRASK